ncbi:MAG: hypothetical protein JO257_38485 [Deltaproteobacteria bacterium]|nr:hypothetical protein [Deltaproteobacteria bacterium]
MIIISLPAAGLVGCIIPPSLGVEQQDAGVNSPPSILSVRSDQTELPEPGPIDIEVGQSSPLNLTLLDTDITDKLYVRVFVDYSKDNQTSPRSSCIAATSGTAQRTATCQAAGICLSTDTDASVAHVMQVMVFDREPLDTAEQPLFQAMPMGGLSTDRTYRLNCKAATTP